MSVKVASSDVLLAHKRIRYKVHETPCLTSETVNKLVGKNVYFKCENFQKTGSFKARGALNAIMAKLERQQSDDRPINGVVTHSSGNHGQGLAWAAQQLNIECTVVVPKGTPAVKIKAIEAYGGKVVQCEPNPQARIETCERISRGENKLIVPPYDDYDVIAGQGTVAVEMLQQIPLLDAIFVPISGGGLVSGIALYAKSVKPSIKVFACEPLGKDLEPSLKSNERLWQAEQKFLNTKADAIRLQQPGQLTFPLMCKLIEKDVFSQSDESMIQAIKFIFERLKVVVELAAGASTSAVLSDKLKSPQYDDLKNVGVILCGGNIDIDNLPW